MFEDVEQRTSARFAEVFSFLSHLKTDEPQTPTDPQPLTHKIGKGLSYVHLYAAVEKSANDIVTASLIEIDSIRPVNRHLRLTFQPIAAHSQLSSHRDCSAKNAFVRSADIFAVSNADNPCSINETMFSLRLQNVWIANIDEVRRCFGMSPTNLTPLDRSLMNSIVECRNKVAHGRESAAEVGRATTCDHLMRLHDLSLSICEGLIDDFRDFITAKRFVKPHFKNRYA